MTTLPSNSNKLNDFQHTPDIKTMKAIFLDIDGVLQPGTQYRFDHIRAGELPALCKKLTEEHGYDYTSILETSTHAKYDIAAVYYDWRDDAVVLMKRLLEEEQAVIVISSNWKANGYDTMEAFLDIWDMGKYLYGMTDPDFTFVYRNLIEREDHNEVEKYWNKRSSEREKAFDALGKSLNKSYKKSENDGKGIYVGFRTVEIREYLDRHPEITDYVAIDDMDLRDGSDGHAVKTSRGYFKEEDFAKAKAILSLHDGPYGLPPETVPEELMVYREKYMNPEVFLPNNGYSV